MKKIVKQRSWDGKFDIEINDKYLEKSECCAENVKTACINLFTKCSSITLEEIADVIISCTTSGYGLDKVIDSKRYQYLDIYLTIKKDKNLNVTYNFFIPNYQLTDATLLAIARNISI